MLGIGSSPIMTGGLGSLQVWRDRRHEAVPEARRKQIFEEYRAVVQDFELYKASLASVDEEEEVCDVIIPLK
jgi:hypothetical protein